MSAPQHPASLTVYNDAATGIRIAVALQRNGRKLAWRRLTRGGMEEAVRGALQGCRDRGAYAVLLPGRPGADPAEALRRCLRRAELDGVALGREEAAPLHALEAA